MSMTVKDKEQVAENRSTFLAISYTYIETLDGFQTA